MTLQIEQIAPLYKVQTCPQIAQELGVKPALVRKVFSDHGIEDPKRLEAEKRRRLILKFHGWGWSNEDIADQVGTTTGAVRMAIRRMCPRWVQLSLFPLDQFTLPLRAMRVVHQKQQEQRVFVDPCQLSFDWGECPMTGTALSVPSPQPSASGLSTSIAFAA